MLYVKFKRDKYDKCNICEAESQLTWDHVPPKGGIELAEMEMRSILQALSTDEDAKRLKITQNGVKYRTICKACNELMGQKYDPVLNKFAANVGRFLKSRLTFPPIIKIDTKPHLLIRAVLGHLLAAKIEPDNVTFDREVRSILFNDHARIPDDIHLFYWVYPYDQQVILRDVAMPAKRGDFSELGIFQVLKYFPVGYVATDLCYYEGLPEMKIDLNQSVAESMEVNVYLDKILPKGWPEDPDRGNFLFMGQAGLDSIHSRPRKKKK